MQGYRALRERAGRGQMSLRGVDCLPFLKLHAKEVPDHLAGRGAHVIGHAREEPDLDRVIEEGQGRFVHRELLHHRVDQLLCHWTSSSRVKSRVLVAMV